MWIKTVDCKYIGEHGFCDNKNMPKALWLFKPLCPKDDNCSFRKSCIGIRPSERINSRAVTKIAVRDNPGGLLTRPASEPKEDLCR